MKGEEYRHMLCKYCTVPNNPTTKDTSSNKKHPPKTTKQIATFDCTVTIPISISHPIPYQPFCKAEERHPHKQQENE